MTPAGTSVSSGTIEGTPTTIEERSEELAALHARIFTESTTPSAIGNDRVPPAPLDLDDGALLSKARGARNGAEFSKLFDQGVAVGEDRSVADLTLCSSLAFWTGKDAARMDRLFRRSALARKTWDERHSSDGRTYGAMTIDKAIAGCREVYAPRGSDRPTQAAQPPEETGDHATVPTYWSMDRLADAYIAAAREPHHRLRLGYPELDAVMRGVSPREVLAILARSSVGKAAFALNLIDRMTTFDALPTLMFSLEMPGISALRADRHHHTGARG
jgi:primase-polymerase (primpol)-like protein